MTATTFPLTSTATGMDAARVRARATAVLMASTAVIAAGTLLGRPLAASDFDSFNAVEPVRDSVWLFSLVAGISIGMTFILVGIAVCLLVADRGAHLATVAALLLGTGGVMFATGFFAIGSANWFATGAVSQSPVFFDFVQDNSMRAFAPQLVGFLLCTAGIILTGIALWRSRVTPRWLAIAILASFVVMFLSGTGIVYDILHAVFMGTLVALAWHLFKSDRHTVRPIQE